jgi:hypothetical protein
VAWSLGQRNQGTRTRGPEPSSRSRRQDRDPLPEHQTRTDTELQDQRTTRSRELEAETLGQPVRDRQRPGQENGQRWVKGRKNLAKKLILYTRRGATQLSYHFDVVNLISQIQSGKNHSCGRIQSIPMFVWEKINVIHYLPRHASTATISLNLAISPSCRFSLGLNSDIHSVAHITAYKN